MSQRLVVENIDVYLGKTRVLSRFSLQVAPGQMVGLVGRNGAGKTTLLRTVMGLLEPAAGSLSFDGTPLSGVAPSRRAHKGIGYMPEDRGLVGVLTVRQNLAVPAWARGLNDVERRIADVCAIVPELEPFLNSPALALSGGQQKLVALGRALMCGDKLLLLDEPFEGVSPVLAARLLAAILRARESGLTVLLAQSDRKGSDSDFDSTVNIERGSNI